MKPCFLLTRLSIPLILSAAGHVSLACADPDGLWTRDPSAAVSDASATFRVDLDRLRAHLSTAPRNARGWEQGVQLTLPLPDGRLGRFRAVETSLLGADVLSACPGARTYRAIGVDGTSGLAIIDITSLGVRALVFTRDGAAVVDPAIVGSTERVTSQWLSAQDAASFECDVIEMEGAVARVPAPAVSATGDPVRHLRYILMGTGEFGEGHGSVEAANAALLTEANRIAGILERDASLQFEVVQIHAFPDADTDPYDNGANMGSIIDRNTVVIDSLFGASSYDIGQVITVIGGTSTRGLGYLPAVCEEWKGGGVVGAFASSAPNLFLTLGHELGHQVGTGGHTQDRACNRSQLSAWEVGSGITILCSMPAACPPDFQPVRDPYYHAGTLGQFATYLATIPSCGSSVSTGNAIPTADAGADYVIPRATPFVLSGSGSDGDVADTLQYTWEQLDTAGTPADSILGPLIRWRLPTTSPVRHLPALATVLSGVPDPYERIINADRTFHFRLLVRDGHPDGGGVAWDDMVVTVSGLPFRVTSPNGGESFDSSQPLPVTWNVGGGSVAANVNILLSTDGGLTWSTLASDVANDGSEPVSFPTTETLTACRIKIEPTDNIFYDVSDADFTLEGSIVSSPVPTGGDVRLAPIEPNPVASDASIRFELPREMPIDLAVIGVGGRRVRTLAAGDWIAGPHVVTWDGLDESGRAMTAGTYFVRLSAAGTNRVEKVTLLGR